jgi:hypothetical protein
MKTQSTSANTVQLACAIGLSIISLTAAGCKSTGYDKSDAAAQSLRSAAAEVQTQSRALEMTTTALSDLVNNPSTDFKPQFRWFSSSLNRLIASADRTDKTGKHMRKKSADYFEAWDEQLMQMNYEYVRKGSEQRKAEVSAQIEAVNARYDESGEVVRPLIAYLVDIRKALSADLTPGGLAAVRKVVANAQENAGKVQTVLSQLASDLSASGTKMSSVAMQADRGPVSPSTEEALPPQRQ